MFFAEGSIKIRLGLILTSVNYSVTIKRKSELAMTMGRAISDPVIRRAAA